MLAGIPDSYGTKKQEKFLELIDYVNSEEIRKLQENIMDSI